MSATLRRVLTPIWLIGSLVALSACVPAGDFCEVVRGELVFAPETAQAVVRTDRPVAEAIDAQNAYWRGNCR